MDQGDQPRPLRSGLKSKVVCRTAPAFRSFAIHLTSWSAGAPRLSNTTMKKSRSIVGIAVGVSTLVLLVAGAMSYRAITELARTSDAVLRAKELELSLERLLSSLRDAETGQRGF